MTVKSTLRFGGLITAALALSACAIIPAGDSICTDGGPNSPGWPYCAPSEPGGPGPVDDPIDPTGGED